jgi:DNA-binding NarL/FixJ family response regulator
VRRVHGGEVVLHPTIARKVAKIWARESDVTPEKASLTTREMEVLRLVCLGLLNKEIAGRLSISVRTVEGHLKTIFNKLQVRSRTEAAMYAASRGWFRIDQASE